MDSKLLIVEDHCDSAEMMVRLLHKVGFDVLVACSCSEALELAAVERPSVVLCDIGLPDGDGCDLLRVLKQRYNNIVGIAISGYAMTDDQKRYIEAGFAGFLVKPCTAEQLKEAIERAIVLRTCISPSAPASLS